MSLKTQYHPLISSSIGTQRHLMSLHYGNKASNAKAYLQASLHADELPGMLVMHHLTSLLAAADLRGAIDGEIVLVPVANPIGLEQSVLNDLSGRYALRNGENFNRHFPEFYNLVDKKALTFGADAANNIALVREQIKRVITAQQPKTELASLRHCLSTLSMNSQLVLDLHCDQEAVLHVYADAPFWSKIEPLARYLGVKASILSNSSEGNTFEQSCGQVWWRLAHEIQDNFPLPLDCISATIELRGQADISHQQAAQDAQAIFNYLHYLGHIQGVAPTLPETVPQPLFWDGMASITAPHAGLVVYTQNVGDAVQANSIIAEIIHPFTQDVTHVKSPISGLLYARNLGRYIHTGSELCRVIGATQLETPAILL